MAKAERIDHIAIFVKDLDKAMQLFGEALGIEFPEPWENKNFDIKETIGPLPLCINLCTPLTPDGEAAKLIEHKGEGVSMISIKVPNLEEAVAAMKARGVRQIGNEKIGDAEMVTFHPKDTFGVMIEFTQYQESHPLTTALGLQPEG